ncbi:MAG: GNAT family N-acetyltransferase [Bacteroidota bacterium]
MILANYGIELVRIRHEHIEMIRQWRNSKPISRHMEFRALISPEMQENWFESVNNIHHFYFLIQTKGCQVGLIHLSKVSFQDQTAHAGIFISDPNYIATSIPVRASLSLLDFAFLNLDLKTVFAKVKNDNSKAWEYNRKLGFDFYQITDNPDFSWLDLTPERYLKTSGTLRSMATKVFGNNHHIQFDEALPIDRLIKERLT